MTTFALPIAQIDSARLDSLLGVREGTQLDFKESLPGNSNDDKREFLSDVTAFANSRGGDLVYGVKEERDANGRPTGVAEEIVGLPGVNIDAERLRLESLLLTSVDPRIAGVIIHEVQRDADPPCLVVRVPRSVAGLHMMTHGGVKRFYGRNSGGKYELDVREIRAAFVRAELAVE